MKKVVLFGTGQMAQIANFYLNKSEEFDVVGFTENKKYMKHDICYGKPIVAFEHIEDFFPPNEYNLLALLGGKQMNKIRENIYIEGKKKNYNFISYISPDATVSTDDIGENCFIFENNVIQPFVKIGNNCILWSGNHIGHHSIINDHNFFSSHIVLCGNCNVNKYCWFGVNSTIGNNINIAEGTLVGMSTNITKNTEKNGVYVGNPHKLIGNSSEKKFCDKL